MADSYHHGNLRQALIDAGIKIINENGEENLSLRKVAAACGVSHAAPYAHFKDKDELIEAIKENVTERFMEKLVDAIEGKPTADAAIVPFAQENVSSPSGAERIGKDCRRAGDRAYQDLVHRTRYGFDRMHEGR